MKRVLEFKWIISIAFFAFMTSCQDAPEEVVSESAAVVEEAVQNTGQEIMVLGTAQDAGYPQMGCGKECCESVWADKSKHRYATSFALIDYDGDEWWLFEATPDIKYQIRMVHDYLGVQSMPAGIFLTHAHMGHYTGLMHLGREVMGSDSIPVYALPRLVKFIKENGPWSQLVELGNIKLIEMIPELRFRLNDNIEILPEPVPHRDEFSETAAYSIFTPGKRYLFVPDIDKWEKWEKDLNELVLEYHYLFLDATFYDGDELGRDMSEIPHPFVSETMEILKDHTADKKQKIHFIHMNHTNPLLRRDSEEWSAVKKKGYKISEQGKVYK